MSLLLLKKQVVPLLLFDNRSQHILKNLSENYKKETFEYQIILLSQLSIQFYQIIGSNSQNKLKSILSLQDRLHTIEKKYLDPLNKALLCYLKIDIENVKSLYSFQELESKNDGYSSHVSLDLFYNEHELNIKHLVKPLIQSISFKDIKNIPSVWFSKWIVLFPPFSKKIISFYNPEYPSSDQHIHIKNILIDLLKYSVFRLGISLYKKYISNKSVSQDQFKLIQTIIHSDIEKLEEKVQEDMVFEYESRSIYRLPVNIAEQQIQDRIQIIKKSFLVKEDLSEDWYETSETYSKRENQSISMFTNNLLHLGILYYLVNQYEMCIHVLVQLLQETKKISKEDKQNKINRHEEFPDIPFMIGSCYLKLFEKNQELEHQDRIKKYLVKAKKAFDKVIKLDPKYQDAYVNLVYIRLQLDDINSTKIFKDYCGSIENFFRDSEPLVFKMLAYKEFLLSENQLSPKSIFYSLLSLTSTMKQDQSKEANKMLKDLKILHILNSHETILEYYQRYLLQAEDENSKFCEGLYNDPLHSTLLFYFGHAFCSLSLKQTHVSGVDYVKIDYINLERSIFLATQSFFFYPSNPSILKLLNNIRNIIRYGCSQLYKKWKSSRVQGEVVGLISIYEDYFQINEARQMLINKVSKINMSGIEIHKNILKDIDACLSQTEKETSRKRILLLKKREISMRTKNLENKLSMNLVS